MSVSKEVNGIEDFNKAITLCDKSNWVTYFAASKKEDGQPWCPDCASSDPVIKECVEFLPNGLTFMKICIERNYWKGEPNEFKEVHGITCLPTLKRWNQQKMLGEDECKDKAQVLAFMKEQQPTS